MLDMLDRGITRLIEWVLIALLAGMVVMVFTNVVLRYGFNTGINFSEEMARFFFVWLTFVGAVITFREHGHIGVETLVKMFGRRGRLVCMAATNAIIFLCAALMFWGTWRQHGINASMVSPVVGVPMIWVFGLPYFTASGIMLISGLRFLEAATGRTSAADIARFGGEWDHGKAHGE
jgi:TRAP-type transport system small permease protein